MSEIQKDYEAVICGAGPVGLCLANDLGLQGIRVLVLEQLPQLIDFPRAIGIDDEALRTLQALGLIDKVLPHITPDHAMRFLTPTGRCFADIQPKTREFGWSRRNAFIQPMVDKVLLQGLERFDHVDVAFSHALTAFEESADGIRLTVNTGDGEKQIQAQYLVACDGGSSWVRRSLGIEFVGETAPNQWMVVDVADDPLATPHVYLCCDPVRPYVSAALPHGIRRFEFMVMQGEREEDLNRDEAVHGLLAKVLPEPNQANIIRRRVYTHNARIAREFRRGRVLLAGDAAHIMPVWQGQGYNSGMRDAFNLGWKLAWVLRGKASEKLLDSYQTERQPHAKAMIDLSVLAGKVLAPAQPWQGKLRDALAWLLDYVPPLKRYFLEMRFKPMPRYREGVVWHKSTNKQAMKHSLVGQILPQPPIRTAGGKRVLLDDVLGKRLAIVCWEIDPRSKLSPANLARWRALGACFVQVVPSNRLQALSLAQDGATADEYVCIGDEEGVLRRFLAGDKDVAALFVRPDRFVAAAGHAQELNACSEALFACLGQGKEQA
ncbi:MAG: bifunctional 3-(3-hydroxy-phenyl)propionate/3-hydroxycinnamic acid hydroxylase [Neisseria sp.]|nr:bifunctional 3-(3-hydroxy-phenyl)propionate/3-hydroxycinnamic acid hydroxylase [Neisseria sp.]